MSAQEVEWVLVVRYLLSTHQATYGRLGGTRNTKDYIQLPQRTDFIDDLQNAFPALRTVDRLPITYRWPTGSEDGTIFRKSADRPHLTWSTRQDAPPPWRMLNHPTEASAETIMGDPSHLDTDSAVQEFRKLMSSGFGQPYLIAVKLRDEPSTLHLRVQIENSDSQFKWADLHNAPPVIRELAASTSKRRAVAWRLFKDGELYFEPDSKVSSWATGNSFVPRVPNAPDYAAQSQPLPESSDVDSDLLAEGLTRSDEEISEFRSRIESDDYEVPDATATVKTRGSAQKAFADQVKKNYEWRCALSGIQTHEFLIASHIVPWSADQTIRLDPANGICFSVFIDRAFEKGFLMIQDDGVVKVNFEKIGDDTELRRQLEGYAGVKLRAPKAHPPKADYLKRRRDL